MIYCPTFLSPFLRAHTHVVFHSCSPFIPTAVDIIILEQLQLFGSRRRKLEQPRYDFASCTINCDSHTLYENIPPRILARFLSSFLLYNSLIQSLKLFILNGLSYLMIFLHPWSFILETPSEFPADTHNFPSYFVSEILNAPLILLLHYLGFLHF